MANGEITSYSGTHLFDTDETDNNEKKIRAYPYANTTNPGGVYILAICHLGVNGTSYPVDPRDCKYDAFKVPLHDRTPPVCPNPIFGTNQNGQKIVTQNFSDPGGIDSIEVVDIINATWSLSGFFQGTTHPVTLVATKIDQIRGARSHLAMWPETGPDPVQSREPTGVQQSSSSPRRSFG